MKIPTLVGVTEIAAMFSVTKSAVSNWRQRFEDFPEPLQTLSSGPIWRKRDVVAWGRKHDKFKEK